MEGEKKLEGGREGKKQREALETSRPDNRR
jgi:hypothetical protein